MRRKVVILSLVGLLLIACDITQQAAVEQSDISPDDPVLVGAGDIASCSNPGDQNTAELLDDIEGTVFTLGDNAYPEGTDAQFEDCYDSSWGRHEQRTRPALGNHDYMTDDAEPYFDYFGSKAGERGKGYYSYDLGEWHIVVLNSNCEEVGGCQAGSPQERWLREDLAERSRHCTLAYFHHALFSSGRHGSHSFMRPIWETLYEAGVDVVLSAHDHHYERFAPQDPNGKPDPERGIRQFIVGTGGTVITRSSARAQTVRCSITIRLVS